MDKPKFPESTIDRNGQTIKLGDMVRNVAAGFSGELASIVEYEHGVDLFMRGSHIPWSVKDTQKMQ